MPEHPLLAAVRPAVRRMAGYAPGEQRNAAGVVKLNTNENPYPPSPHVAEAAARVLADGRLRKYPEPLGDSFRRAAGEVLGVDPDSVLCGNGSDDLLTILTRAFVPEGGLVGMPTPSYVLYRSLAEVQGASCAEVPFTPDWGLPDPWPAAGAHLTFLPNPNSPSGTCVGPAAVERLAARLRGPLVLDEAYADFADANGLHLVSRVPNVMVTRTMSKFYALAGVRFGYLVAPPEVVRELAKVKDSYNVDALSLAAATAAIRDRVYYADLRTRILATRDALAGALAGLGFRVTPSQANFVWCTRPDRPVGPVYEALKARDVLVRFMRYPSGEGLRVTVGTPAGFSTGATSTCRRGTRTVSPAAGTPARSRTDPRPVHWWGPPPAGAPAA